MEYCVCGHDDPSHGPGRSRNGSGCKVSGCFCCRWRGGQRGPRVFKKKEPEKPAARSAELMASISHRRQNLLLKYGFLKSFN